VATKAKLEKKRRRRSKRRTSAHPERRSGSGLRMAQPPRPDHRLFATLRRFRQIALLLWWECGNREARGGRCFSASLLAPTTNACAGPQLLPLEHLPRRLQLHEQLDGGRRYSQSGEETLPSTI
jgi:hypothetical protein